MKPYYTIQEAADFLHCSTRRVYYLIQRRRIIPITQRPTLITGEELLRYASDPKRLKALNLKPQTSKRTRESTC